MDIQKKLTALLNTQSPDIVAVGELLLDHAASRGSLSGTVSDDAICLTSGSDSCSIPISRGAGLFRMILARLGVQAAEITGREVNLYRSETRFDWKGVAVRQTISNELSKPLAFDIGTCGC